MPEALTVLSDLLERIRAGEVVDFDAVCAGRPDLSRDLRKLREEWATGADVVAASHAMTLTGAAEQGASARAAPAREDASVILGRYRVDRELGRGGMGEVLAVYDPCLDRDLALKRTLHGWVRSGPGLVARFLEEARVTAQLDHPGIVPVHGIALDGSGDLFYTMRRVEGRDLGALIDEMHHPGSSSPPWSRIATILLRVCETMDYAHRRGVIHRDLKPANVMVGAFGETYVMDFGVAHVLGAGPVRVDDTSGRDAVASVRGEFASLTLTHEGDVLGTPCYMPLEQAKGAMSALSPAVDVYAVGAILYRALSGHTPYVEAGEKSDAAAILTRLVEGPPRTVESIAPRVPAELVSICARAMARRPTDRYASMHDFAADLRAFLEGRVVRAHATGPLAEMKTFLRRNRRPAVGALVAGMLVVAGLAAFAVVAEQSRRATEAETAKVLRLSDLKRISDLERRAADLWPAVPANEAALAEWLADSLDVTERSALHHATLEAFSAEARRPDGTVGFDDPAKQWELETLTALVERLDRFASEDEFEGSVASAKKRLAVAPEIGRISLVGAADAWRDAILEIADPERSPDYGGLRLTPQLGLVPLGKDPESGLYDFWHVASGSRPECDEDGVHRVGGEAGLVMVLLPGGTFKMGAQKDDPSAPNYDPAARPNEGPVNDVTLDPFFMSKYEMTFGQWWRSMGRERAEPADFGAEPSEGSWNLNMTAMQRLGLVLPTEAQWEYACRAGTSTPWSTGEEPTSLQGHANVADEASFAASVGLASFVAGVRDDFRDQAPVGSFVPNAFGLHDMHGNRAEWCLDLLRGYLRPPRAGDGYRLAEGVKERALRGGSHADVASLVRSAVKNFKDPGFIDDYNGCRPARRLDP